VTFGHDCHSLFFPTTALRLVDVLPQLPDPIPSESLSIAADEPHALCRFTAAPRRAASLAAGEVCRVTALDDTRVLKVEWPASYQPMPLPQESSSRPLPTPPQVSLPVSHPLDPIWATVDSRLSQRAGHLTCDSDVESVGAAARTVAQSVAAGGQLDRNNLVQRCSDGDVTIMYRCFIYEGEHCSVRLHWYPGESPKEVDPEEYVHNHKSNAISVCIAGRYEHHLWRTDPAEGRHFSCRRQPDGTLSQFDDRAGKLRHQATFSHTPGHAFFLRNSAYHTLVTFPGTPVLTLFFRDRAPNSPTEVLVHAKGTSKQEPTPPRMEPSHEEDVVGVKKEEVLCAMEHLLRQSGGIW